VSSSRYERKARGSPLSDEAGDVAEEETKKAGHAVTVRELVSDDAAMIRREAKRFLGSDDDVLLFTGGTGVSSRDITIETVRPLLQKELPGFGELLRRISYSEIGSAAMLTRATAGTAKGKLLVCMPGSPDAVKTAIRASISEFPHIVSVARRPLPLQ
jgi:molybdopterin adenylyltransferase